MKKDIIVYKIYLYILFVAYLVTILFNLEMFTFQRILSFVFGVGYCILALVCLWFSFMVNSNSRKSFFSGIIFGFVVFVYSVLECFLPGGFVIKHLRIINLIYPIFGVLLILLGINVLYVRKEEEELLENSLHRHSHSISKRKEIKNKKSIDDIFLYEGLVVDGYIKDVVLIDDKYSLEIEYLYDGEKYIFNYGEFEEDISNILDKKNLRRISIYLPDESPEYAQIDEELLMYMINN